MSKKVNIHIVPHWVRKACTQNKLSDASVLDYSRVRDVLSIEDMVDYFSSDRITNIPNNCFFSPTAALNSGLYGGILEPSGEQLLEFKNTILPLLYSDASRQRNYERLSCSLVEMLDIEDVKTYDIVTINNDNVIVFINSGFVNTLDNPNARFIFIKTVLRSLYALRSMHDVAHNPIYKEYLNALLK